MKLFYKFELERNFLTLIYGPRQWIIINDYDPCQWVTIIDYGPCQWATIIDYGPRQQVTIVDTMALVNGL